MRLVARTLANLPPPLLFVVSLVLGLRIDQAHPVQLVPASAARTMSGVGIVLTATSIVFAVSAIGLFVRRRTTIVPHRRSRALVTNGPFRITRNPMYVALTCAVVGISLFANALWPLLLLAIPLLYLQTITIPREERLLREAFGADYDTYASRVRRWI